MKAECIDACIDKEAVSFLDTLAQNPNEKTCDLLEKHYKNQGFVFKNKILLKIIELISDKKE